MGKLTIPRDQVIAQALQRINDGETLRQIAPSFNVSHVTLWSLLIGDVPDQYKQAQQAVLIGRIADADQALEDAEDQLNLARAREQAKFARWDAERRLPNLFGAKQTVEHKHTVDLDAAMQDARKALQARKTHTTYSVEAIEDAQIVGDSSAEST